jgi:hypothetical protein
METKENRKIYLWFFLAIIALIFVAVIANKNAQKPSDADNRTSEIFTQKTTPQKITTAEVKPKPISKYLHKYAGEYTILVDDFFDASVTEKLILDSEGNCTWKWIQNGSVQSTKYGTWTAEKGYIYTVVQGNSGELPEDFNFKNGAFRNGHRYLKLKRKF